MRILYVTHGYYYGSGKVLRTLISGMVARGHEVAVVSQATPDDRWWPNTPESLTVYPYGTVPCIVPTVARALVEFAPDVMDAQMLRESACAAIARQFHAKRVPMVIVEHSQVDLRSAVGRLAFRFATDEAERVVFPSATARAGWQDTVPTIASGARVIPNAVDVPPSTRCRQLTREGLGVPLDAAMALNVAYVGSNKNQSLIARAVAAMKPKYRESLFVLVAGGIHDPHEMDEALRIAAEAGMDERIVFLGYRADVADLYAACDVALLSSRSECAPIAVLEAMAAARPVISTACGGPQDIVIDGETGFLVPIDDAEAMARAIETLIEDPGLARRMGEAGRRRVEERYSVDAFCDAYEQLYREMIEQWPMR